MFSTVLFVNGNPVGYKISTMDANHVVLNPAENPERVFQPPVLEARNNSGRWLVEGTDNQDLIDQVVEDMDVRFHLPTHSYTAAP